MSCKHEAQMAKTFPEGFASFFTVFLQFQFLQKSFQSCTISVLHQHFIPLPCWFRSDRISNFVHSTDIPLLLPNYKPRHYCVLMQTSIDTHITGSPSAHCSMQNTQGDWILSGRGGLGEHQTTWLIRQCADCICFPFVSRHLRWRHSVVIKPLSETELDKSWSGSSGSIMRTRDSSWQVPMNKNGTPPPMNILL